MPPKKKNKYANAAARGFATTSIPKAKPGAAEPEPEPEPAPAPAAAPDANALVATPPPPIEEELEDEFVSLAERLESLSLKKVDAFLGQTQKINIDTLPVLKMESNLENSVIGLLKEAETKDATDFKPNVYLNKEQTVAKLNVTYLALLRLGFEKDDIEEALKHTYTGDSEDALDWLCMHLDSEKLPRGFADKVYHDEEMKISAHSSQPFAEHTPSLPVSTSILILSTAQPQKEEREKASVPEHVLEPVVETITASKEKEWILQAALAEESEEEALDPNERYVSYKMTLVELTQTLAETKEPVDRKAIARKMESLNSKINDLDIDFTFNKKLAESMLKQRLIDEKKRAKKSKRKKEKEQEALMKESPTPFTSATIERESAGDDDGGDMLGFIGDMENLGNTDPPSTITPSQQGQSSVSRRVMANPSWSGGSPKVVLAEFCRKKDRHSKVVYKKASRSSSTASMATVTVTWGSGNVDSAEMSEEGCENMVEAENYAATKMLYNLTSLPLYRSLPPTYRDLWLEWIDEKESAGRIAKKAIDGDRLSFIKGLTAKLPNRGNTGQNEIGLVNDIDKIETKEQKDKEGKNFITSIGRTLQENWQQRLKRPNYIKLFEKRKELPIYKFRDQLLTTLENHQVLIVSGETGCGKSTQVPQYLVEYMLESGLGDQCDIVCTQPRRISAISIANRVSEELGDARNSAGKPNTLVGYQIRLESRVAPSNILKFCTTGILLRRLESDGDLKGVTHLVIDEVHERTLESDFLLIILKKLLPRRPDLKIILMSATVDSARFSQYFGGCPVLEVPGRTFPVHPQFLEDVVEFTGYTLEEDSEYAVRYRKDIQSKGSVDIAGKGASRQTVHLQWEREMEGAYIPQEAEARITMMNDTLQDPVVANRSDQMLARIDENKINYELIQLLLEYICFPEDRRTWQGDIGFPTSEPERSLSIPGEGAILIFLPGMPEIRKVFDGLKANRRFADETKFSLWPLHSSISSEGQNQVFDTPAPGVRKIVLATNIAETGITIPDVTIVIDTGKSKQIKFDEKKRVTTLQERFIARANVRQRRGRAGRVQEGVCFHLFSKTTFEETMPEYQMPEIMRMPLEELCLMIKMCQLGEIAEVLGSALDAPPVKAIENAIQALQDVRALTKTEELTPLGIHLCNLPVDVHIGKMILFGAIFKCLDPILTIAAMLSFKSPFVTPFGAEDEADAAKAKFKLADSDMLTWYNAYLGWRQSYQQHQKMGGIYDYCRKNFLSHQNLSMVEDMKRQFLEFLIGTGFVQVDAETKRELNKERFNQKITFCPVIQEYNVYQRSIPVLNAAITAGMYPKVMMRNDQMKAYVTGPKQETVWIHPSSVNFTKGGAGAALATAAAAGQDLSPWFVFNSLVKSTRMYVWESCRIGQFPLVLFGGELSVKHHAKLVTVDKWIQFKCHAKTAVVFKMMREELEKILRKRIDEPEKGTTEREGRWLQMIVAILEGEDDSLRLENKASHQRNKDKNVFLA
ncbi:P-loop containing nucleoside triphosphate hydrolase protein [Lobosporangium transversale]|uniref:RNA helicase n=1 Tax=Lobosporangium transversale TaxID=64571 RepID=A0A1Y2GPD6_9FUNG|nr:P-loop containing nucleoside triphosphate hydrolase protein [Lobosporangium transversale]ORZ13412.1 P-loop containing nucleoside triphosphate hydrolase protein [Lobosporangium transversale]|eukprot:XP_021880493.1 P-loop containing nucleoside triphosphate hydrolase protein [Lobosporangium transversale]